jgi:hypothetical protein
MASGMVVHDAVFAIDVLSNSLVLSVRLLNRWRKPVDKLPSGQGHRRAGNLRGPLWVDAVEKVLDERREH